MKSSIKLPHSKSRSPSPSKSAKFGLGVGVLSAVTGSGGGVKRTVEMPITAVTDEYIQMGNPYKNTCQGDSGGPIFRLMGGIERVIAIGSFGEFGCRGASTKTRLDLYGDFIAE